MTCVHMTTVICFYRGFGVRSFKVYDSLVTGVPDFPMNLKHRWTYSLSGLSPMADGKSLLRVTKRVSSSLSLGTLIYHFLTLPRLLTPVLKTNGSDIVTKSRIAIPCDKISMCSRTPILQFLTLYRILTRVLLGILWL